MVKRLQLTLAILKPHVVCNPVAVQDIKTLMMKNKFKTVEWKKQTINMELAAKFYEEHKTKFFYNRLVTFMTSGPSEIYILARENAINEWRTLMGPTKVFKTQFEAPNTIRGIYGYSDTRNASHGSDSETSAKREIGIFFPEFDYDHWFDNQRKCFRKNLNDLPPNKILDIKEN